VLSNLIHLVFAFIVVIVLFAIWGVDVNIHFLWIIPATALVAIYAYGLSAMLAAWSAFYADVRFIVGNLMGLWFFLTPVLYPVSLVLNKQIEKPSNWVERVLQDHLPVLKQIFMLDPVTIGVEGYRSALLHGGENFIIVAATPELPAAQAAAVQVALRQEYPLLPYILGAAAVAVATAIIGQIIFRRKADLFAERG
jgi:ABC-type polysaccharide/polyol phosphate export permease